MEEKIEIIDKIVTKHPSLGVDKGWSDYTGGMKDAGQWHYRKMLDVPTEELKHFLNNILSDEGEVTYLTKESGKVLWNEEGTAWAYESHIKKETQMLVDMIMDDIVKETTFKN